MVIKRSYDDGALVLRFDLAQTNEERDAAQTK
jgi:hypothetical protein